MIDAEKQIVYWRKGAEEDIAVARELLEKKRIRHGLFFVHLSLEKMLKAHFCPSPFRKHVIFLSTNYLKVLVPTRL